METHAFCRALLREAMTEVNKMTSVTERKAVNTYHSSCTKMWEVFDMPSYRYWYGKACCGWHARYLAWTSWLDKRDREKGGNNV